ncbi:MAG TPA: regulatory protein RecX [Bacteroidales bacterium]|nr:regulatory protein RecX [Bacteroidales bacterium]
MERQELIKSALNKAMYLCSKREYCREEIRQKLVSWDVSNSDSEKILDSLVAERFIDESRYANAFTRDKFKYNKWGKVKIASQLKLKRIPMDIISESLGGIDHDAYVLLLKDLLTAQKKRIKANSEYELKGKLLRFALSKGFESSLVYEILWDE